jgi:hypothetical protein
MRSATSGKLVVSENEELLNLDSAVDGPIRFDATTGTAYVGCDSVSTVQDNFACTTSPSYGYPVYGLDPGCRDLAQNPDRALAVVRPLTSSYGTLYAHKKTCPVGIGLRPEITPVEIVPSAFPAPVTTGIKYLAYRKVDATDDCTPATTEFLEGLGVPNVDNANLASTDGGGDALLPADDSTTAFAIWEQSGGVWTLKRVQNSALPALVKGATAATTTGAIDFLDSPVLLYSQYKVNAAFSGSPTVHFPPAPAYTTGPTLTETVDIDLANKVKYSVDAKGALLNIVLKGGSDPSTTCDVVIVVDGVEYARIVCPPNGYASTINQVSVKIPTTKKLSVSLQMQLVSGDPVMAGILGMVYLQGFTY